MGIFNIFHKKASGDAIVNDAPTAMRKDREIMQNDWRDLDTLPEEVVSKKELDALQNEVIAELEYIQASAKKQEYGGLSAEPQALFYYHKYIDSKFNKSDFDIETYFSHKQNIVDKKYAEGLGDLNQEFTGYIQLLEEVREYEQRFRRKTNKLDPESKMDLETSAVYNDSLKLLEQIKELPSEINWGELKEC